jgi:hypothetical protein
MSHETQGKCPVCVVAYRWTVKIKVREAFCGTCGAKIVPTTKFFVGPWFDQDPIKGTSQGLRRVP